MAIIKNINNHKPTYGKRCFFAETAHLIGDVTLGDDCSVWFNAILRGDVNPIYIGNRVNIQDNAVVHCMYKRSEVEIADNVTISHNVTIHGAKIHENVLVGIGAIVLDFAEIGANSIIAAGAVVLENTKVEPYSIMAGVPAKMIGEVSLERAKNLNLRIANNYLKYAGWYKEKESE